MIYTAFILTIVICVLLVLYHWKHNKAIILLSFMFFMVGQRMLIYLLLESGTDPEFLAYIYIHNIPFALLMGPALYNYIKSVIFDRIEFKAIEWLSFIPSLLAFICLEPYFEIPISTKIHHFELLFALQTDSGIFNNASRWISIRFFQNAVGIINSIYFLYCCYYLIQARKQANKILIKKLNNLLKILIIIAFFTVCPALIVYVTLYKDSHFFINSLVSNKNFPQLEYLSLFTLATPILILFSPSWLYASPILSNQQNRWDNFLAAILDKPSPELPPAPPKPEDDSDIIRIKQFLIDEKQYLNSSLSIHEISRSLDIPQARVTYYFNKVLKVPFPKLRNQLRIEHAIELLKQNAHLTLSIEGIAMQSGFKNKSTFYLAFKDEKGMTPLDWINKQ